MVILTIVASSGPGEVTFGRKIVGNRENNQEKPCFYLPKEFQGLIQDRVMDLLRD
jgi:hypothetical protein